MRGPVRIAAIETLSACAGRSADANAALQALAKDPDPDIAANAKRVLARPRIPRFGQW